MKHLPGWMTSLLLLFLVTSLEGFSQPGRNAGSPPSGRIYGKVQDDATRKPIEFAVLQVYSVLADSSTKLVSGGLSEANGDFSIEGIPAGTDCLLRINMVGYAPQDISFRLTPGGSMGLIEKDMGNIRLVNSATLGTVVIEGEVPEFRMEFDKRVYEVDKNPANAGGTGEDVLRNIPGVAVDTDGNVSVRNTSPQIFIDGRPTTLSIDQIPSDAIQRVEIITNPSAKYDASGGGGGIINIVMKHNRGMGYNGNVRAGVDMRGRVNGGLDLNLREGKFNFFVNGNLNQRKSISTGWTERTQLSDPNLFLTQDQESVNVGYFARGNAGVDWFLDNRNTLTVSQSLNRGLFQPTDEIDVETDTLADGSEVNSHYFRFSDTERQFQNLGTSLLYKHLFSEEGDELTADINYNAISSEFEGYYLNQYDDTAPSELRQEGNVEQTLLVGQVDFVNTFSDKLKLEAGLRASWRDYTSSYDNFSRNQETGVYEEVEQLQVNYHYLDQVVAAYSTISINREKWKYQLGLRLESSDYRAELLDTTVSFRNTYPLSLFPSAYITRVIDDNRDVQLALNRRISRPGFMQLSPFTDYSDSLNVSRGNPALRPEFTQSAELSYQHVFSKKHTFIASTYVRYTTDLTIRQQYTEFSPVIGTDIVVNTYENASSSTALGMEFIARNSFAKWFDMTTNINLYQSRIDGSNIDTDLKNTISSWWAKVNATFKLPKNTTFQVIADYSSRRALEVGSGERSGGRGGGGGGGWNMPTNTVQGYVMPNYGVDLSVRKDFFKDRTLTLTLSMSDVFRTRINEVHSESDFFIQDTFRRRDPQLWRVNLSWKFGKTDASVFRRRNTRQGGEMMEG